MAEEGRGELANDLAMALMNKGNALQSQGRLGETIASYDAAIAIRQRLVDEEGRQELAGGLAMALANKAFALAAQQQSQEALTCFDAAIRWWDYSVQAGMTHLLPDMLRAIRYCTRLLLAHHQWAAAAANVARALTHTLPVLQASTLPAEPLRQERESLLGLLRDLTPDERAEVLAHLGPWAEVVRQLLSQGEG